MSSYRFLCFNTVCTFLPINRSGYSIFKLAIGKEREARRREVYDWSYERLHFNQTKDIDGKRNKKFSSIIRWLMDLMENVHQNI